MAQEHQGCPGTMPLHCGQPAIRAETSVRDAVLLCCNHPCILPWGALQGSLSAGGLP